MAIVIPLLKLSNRHVFSARKTTYCQLITSLWQFNAFLPTQLSLFYES
jgi:hypothetical protein